MKNKINFSCFAVLLALLSSLNLYFSNLISQKLNSGWQFSCPLFKLVYVKNTGAAFSILQDSRLFLMSLSALAVIAIFIYAIKNINSLRMSEALFLAFLTSGILGNLYERAIFGYVRDFIDLTFVNFAIFNISDVFINIGGFGIMILILLAKKPKTA